MIKVIWIGMLLAALGAIGIGGYLAYFGKDGWLFFLIAGCIISIILVVGTSKSYTSHDLRNAFDAARASTIAWGDYYQSIQPKSDDDDDNDYY